MLTNSHIATAGVDTRGQPWPADSCAWLSVAEQDELLRLRHPSRRTEWIGGRWLLKGMLLRSFAGNQSDQRMEECRRIEILSRDALGRPQVPRTFRDGRALPVHVSLSHAGGVVWAAVSSSSTVRVGIDVVEARSVAARLQSLWFTPDELQWVRASGDDRRAAELWSAKEAVYKATNCGEPFAPASCEIHADEADVWCWSVRSIPCRSDEAVSVRRIGGLFVAVAAAVTCGPRQNGGLLNAGNCQSPASPADGRSMPRTLAGVTP